MSTLPRTSLLAPPARCLSLPELHILTLFMPLQVLLVEDNPGDVRLTTEAVHEAHASMDLHVVSDGAEAIAFLGREGTRCNAPRPDLILLDLYLPKLDGRMVLAHIKRSDNLKTIPTVILTTSDSESDVAKSYDLQANCVLRKPHQWCEFKELVKSIVEFWLRAVTLPPLYEAHQENPTSECLLHTASPKPQAAKVSAYPVAKPTDTSWPDFSGAASLRRRLSTGEEEVGVQSVSIGKQRECCARCSHPTSDHQNGRCAGMVRQVTRRFLQCGCKESITASKGPSQAAGE